MLYSPQFIVCNSLSWNNLQHWYHWHLCPRCSIFNYSNFKNLIRSIWSIIFCKHFPISVGYIFIELSCVFDFISRFHFHCVILRIDFFLLSITSNLSIYFLFVIEVKYLCILFIKVLIDFSATTEFPLLCVEYVFYINIL